MEFCGVFAGATLLRNLRAARRFWRAGGPRPQRRRTCDTARNSQHPGSGVAAATGDRSRSSAAAAPPPCTANLQKPRSPRGIRRAAFMPLERERCWHVRTRDDVRTVKRRKRRAPWVGALPPFTTTLQKPCAPRGFFLPRSPRPQSVTFPFPCPKFRCQTRLCPPEDGGA